MSNNIDELKDVAAALRADRLAQKEKEVRESWTKYVSLSMIFLAVLAAVTTQRGGSYSSATIKQLNEATFFQAKASDQWAFYQAKGIKQSILESEVEQLKSAPNPDSKRLADVTAHVSRYDREKKEISAEANHLEAERDTARALATKAADASREMGLASSVFQIGIALGGITLVVKKRWLWYASLLAGVAATLQMAKVLSGQ